MSLEKLTKFYDNGKFVGLRNTIADLKVFIYAYKLPTWPLDVTLLAYMGNFGTEIKFYDFFSLSKPFEIW